MMLQQDPNNFSQPHDDLYCEEGHWEEDEEGQSRDFSGENGSICQDDDYALRFQEDPFWEEDDLSHLIAKERSQEQDRHSRLLSSDLQGDPFLSSARRDAVEWMLRVRAHYAFTAHTAVLSVNFLDRFISSVHFKRDKPWMAQLAAVSCLSLAAKMEETQVPLLLDLQVENAKFVFEPKTIQRMELLVLSTLNWKMNPVTPLSFVDHTIRRLGLRSSYLNMDFLWSCERLILSAIADPRYVCYPPSVFAAATMLLGIHQLGLSNPLDCENQLLGILHICKEKVSGCLRLLVESASGDVAGGHKRKAISKPLTPSRILDTPFSWDDSSDDSWTPSSAAFSPSPAVSKKCRTQEDPLPL